MTGMASTKTGVAMRRPAMKRAADKAGKLVARHSWIRFGMVGAAATVIHYGVYYLLMQLGMRYSFAYALGYGISLCFNFWATGRFTFRTSLSARKGTLFLLSHGINFVLHMSLLELFVRVAGINPKIAPIFVYLIAVPVNFLLVRFSMKDKKYAKDSPPDTLL